MNKISMSELTKVIGLGERSVLTSKGFPKTIKINDDLFYSIDDICKYFNIQDLNEPFIGVDEAAEKLRTNTATLAGWANKSVIPSYRVKKVKGSKLLFRASDIIKFKEELSEHSPNSKFLNTFMLRKELETLFIVFLESESSSFLRTREVNILNEYILKGRSMESLSDEYSLTTTRIKQIFEKAIRRTKHRIYNYVKDNKVANIHKENSQLELKNIALQAEVDFLKSKLYPQENQDGINTETIMKLMTTRLVDFDMNISVRLLNCLKAADYEYFYDIAKTYTIDKKYFLKLRGFGNSTFKELEPVIINNFQSKTSINLHSFFKDKSWYNFRKQIELEIHKKNGYE